MPVAKPTHNAKTLARMKVAEERLLPLLEQVQKICREEKMAFLLTIEASDPSDTQEATLTSYYNPEKHFSVATRRALVGLVGEEESRNILHRRDRDEAQPGLKTKVYNPEA